MKVPRAYRHSRVARTPNLDKSKLNTTQSEHGSVHMLLAAGSMDTTKPMDTTQAPRALATRILRCVHLRLRNYRVTCTLERLNLPSLVK